MTTPARNEKEKEILISIKKIESQNLSRMVGNAEYLTKTEQKQDGAQISYIKVL